jgi:ornithine cyclodeaminase
MRRARIFVDTRAGATSEGGDIVQPLKAGVIGERDIIADLYDLARDLNPGRTGEREITVFKSVGAALEDLAAGIAVYEALTG